MPKKRSPEKVFSFYRITTRTDGYGGRVLASSEEDAIEHAKWWLKATKVESKDEKQNEK